MIASLQWIMRSCLLVLIAPLVGISAAAAQSSDCADSVDLAHAFSSGATWSLCASVDDEHGLQVTNVLYRAPGNFDRQVLHTAHLSQLLLHYHDSALPEAQINAQDSEQNTARKSLPLSMNSNNCAGELVFTNPELPEPHLCTRIKNNHILAKFAQRPSLQSESWELLSAFERDSLTWTVSITFTEDGQIVPGVTLSGRATRTSNDERYSQAIDESVEGITRASILSTWRLVFALDTEAADRVEQFEFPLRVEQGNRRPLQMSTIETETLTKVNRENFRGWRVLDGSGAGYYLDPANSGFSYRNQSMNWAQFDVAVTRYRECERHALFNKVTDDAIDGTAENCGSNLDDFVDGEPMQGAQPVIWYSQTRSFRPSREDWPVISNVHLSFNLMPFDWTPSSPFEVIDQ